MEDRRGISQFGYLLLLVSALLLAVFLALEAAGVAGNPYILNQLRLRIVYLLAISLGPWLALVLAGVLVYLSLNDSYSRGRFFKALSLFLGILLALGVTAATLRQGVLVRTTSRAPEDHFPLLSLFLTLGIGLTLLFIHKGRFRSWGAAFLVVVSVLISMAYWLGLRLDPHAITEARAEQVGQAIERYRQDTGSYPAELGQLKPGYLPLLLGPLNGRGQSWCYQSGPDFYRLGYVLFERYHLYSDDTPFWEPYYEVRVPASSGQPPAGPWACDAMLERMKQGEGLFRNTSWLSMVWQGDQDG